MPYYQSRSEARSACVQLFPGSKPVIYETPMGFTFRPSPGKGPQPFTDEDRPKRKKPYYGKSTVERPVQLCRRILREMHGQPRGLIMKALLDLGVNRSTASTQYCKYVNSVDGSATTPEPRLPRTPDDTVSAEQP